MMTMKYDDEKNIRRPIGDDLQHLFEVRITFVSTCMCFFTEKNNWDGKHHSFLFQLPPYLHIP